MRAEKKELLRSFCVDEDVLEITFLYDDSCSLWIGQYPFFKEEPRYTPFGRPWRNAALTECPHHGGEGHTDCGSCPYFKKQESHDLIGVCFNEKLRLKGAHRT